MFSGSNFQKSTFWNEMRLKITCICISLKRFMTIPLSSIRQWSTRGSTVQQMTSKRLTSEFTNLKVLITTTQHRNCGSPGMAIQSFVLMRQICRQFSSMVIVAQYTVSTCNSIFGCVTRKRIRIAKMKLK